MNTLNRWFLALKIRFLTIHLHDLEHGLIDGMEEKREVEMKLKRARADYHALTRASWKQA